MRLWLLGFVCVLPSCVWVWGSHNTVDKPGACENVIAANCAADDASPTVENIKDSIEGDKLRTIELDGALDSAPDLEIGEEG